MESTKTTNIKLIKNCNRCGEELCCYRWIGTFCPTGCADYQIVSKEETNNEYKNSRQVQTLKDE